MTNDDCVKTGMNWLYGYHDNEYMIKLNTKQIEKAILISVQQAKQEVFDDIDNLAYQTDSQIIYRWLRELREKTCTQLPIKP